MIEPSDIDPAKAQGSALRRLREEWADYLNSLPYFQDVTIIVEDRDDIEAESAKALGPCTVTGEKIGVCLMLATVTAKFADTGEFGPIFDDVKMMAISLENVEENRKGANGTRKSYEEVIEQAAGYSQGLQLLSARGPMVADDSGIVLSDAETLGWPGKQCMFGLPGTLNIRRDQIPELTITNNAGEISITCETPGAAIFYTIGARKPIPRAPAYSNLYLAPFTPAAGSTINARAYLAGFLSSPIAKLTI